MNSREGLQNFKQCFKLLTAEDRVKLAFFSIAQLVLNFLDLFGVLMIGYLTTLVTPNGTNVNSFGVITKLQEALGLSNVASGEYVLFISFLAIGSLIGRTVFSILITKKLLGFLSKRGAIISAKMLRGLLSQPIQKISRKSTQENVFAVTRGVEIAVLHVIGTSIIVLADFYLLVILSIGLLIIDPVIAFGTGLIFGIVGVMLYKFMHIRSALLGKASSQLAIRNNQQVVETIDLYRETFVQNRFEFYIKSFLETREKLAQTQAGISFLPYVSKYVIESTLITSAALLAFFQLYLAEDAASVTITAIFLAAGLRVSPAVLRIQQGAIQIRGSLSMIDPTLELFKFIPTESLWFSNGTTNDFKHIGFIQEIQAKDVEVNYSDMESAAISGINFKVEKGNLIGICGPSGSGKSTLVDALLGILPLVRGDITISGLNPDQAFKKWPGAVAYVPQEIVIVEGTILDNICLGYPKESFDLNRVEEAIEIAQLSDFVRSLPNGVLSDVGENGSMLSGGQRQRLGLARALFGNPKIIILDESTSSLDSLTEEDFISALTGSLKELSILLVTHNYASLQSADAIYYIKDGCVLNSGRFSDLMLSCSEFAAEVNRQKWVE